MRVFLFSNILLSHYIYPFGFVWYYIICICVLEQIEFRIFHSVFLSSFLSPSPKWSKFNFISVHLLSNHDLVCVPEVKIELECRRILIEFKMQTDVDCMATKSRIVFVGHYTKHFVIFLLFSRIFKYTTHTLLIRNANEADGWGRERESVCAIESKASNIDRLCAGTRLSSVYFMY